MKLFTNNGNLNGLKILISAFENSQSIEIVQSINNGHLLVSGNLKLFSIYSSCLYLYEMKDDSDSKLLSWERNVLYPSVLSALRGILLQKSSESLLSLFELIAQKIEILFLASGNFLNGKSSRNLIDVVFWCDLYPIASDETLSKELFQKCPKLLIWFTFLKSLWCHEVRRIGLSEGCHNEELKSFLLSLPPSSKLSEEEERVSKLEIEKSNHEYGTLLWSRTKEVKKSTHKILPSSKTRNILISSALPYVNNVPHLGNIIGCVLSADVYARYSRLMGYTTLYICGTDEHGTTTETKAIAEGLSPQEICDKYHALHSEIYSWFNISFDHFGRTTCKESKEITQDIFKKIYSSGVVVEQPLDQYWCSKCNRFLADRFVEGICPNCHSENARGDQCDGCGKLINSVELIAPKCVSCFKAPSIRNTTHLFLDLPQLEDKLKDWLQKTMTDWSHNVRGIANSWLKMGLQPRCITRDLKWGISVPLKGYEDKVFYVWFDAPIGYIGITAEYTEHWKEWWSNSSTIIEYYQFMGKDNVPFHSILFPAIQLGTMEPWTMVKNIYSTEYLNYEDSKFSKSRGIGVFGNNAKDTGISADIWRFYLIYTRPESSDSTFKWKDFQSKNNSELLGNLGNFCHRALKFCKDNFRGQISKEAFFDTNSGIFLTLLNRRLQAYIDLLEKAREREALSQILHISRLGNQFIQKTAPWKLIKGSDFDRKKAGSLISICVNVTALISILLEPFMPSLSQKLQSMLNVSDSVNQLQRQFVQILEPGHEIGVPEPLVPELKDEDIVKFEKMYSGTQI